MGISYKPLWKLLIDKEITRTELRTIANVSGPTIAKMGRDEYVALEVLEKICMALDCKISDVIEVTSEEKKKE